MPEMADSDGISCYRDPAKGGNDHPDMGQVDIPPYGVAQRDDLDPKLALLERHQYQQGCQHDGDYLEDLRSRVGEQPAPWETSAGR